jgi:hypothetical protein
MIDLSQRFTKNNIHEFVELILKIDAQIGFKVSSRGWGYLMEQHGIIDKSQFDKVENLINRCRKRGWLPVDFVAEDEARQFSGIERADGEDLQEYFNRYLRYLQKCQNWYTPDWWADENYYIQMIVEKIDLVTLFEPVAHDYHIPIANAKGWSSILQRASYARRFKEAEERGLKCVLLYCGDHDPDGLRISDQLRKNLQQVSRIHWEDGEIGYDPSELIIDRFGLNLDFIEENGLTWIDNLMTGGGHHLAIERNGQILPGRTRVGKIHPNWELDYLQEYLAEVGVRKCEANALVVIPEQAKQLCRDIIEKYLGADALDRFKRLQLEARGKIIKLKNETGIQEHIDKIQDIVDNLDSLDEEL